MRFKYFYIIIILLGAAGCGNSANGLIGTWDPIQVEKEDGVRISVRDKLALSKIKGAVALASSRPFELTKAGDYLTAGNRSRWHKMGENRFVVIFKVHGQDQHAVMRYQLNGDELKISREDGKFWLVLQRSQKKKT